MSPDGVINQIQSSLLTRYVDEWRTSMQTISRLEHYRYFKEDLETAEYVKHLPRNLRSVMARARTGTLPLNIELGRYRGLARNDRICQHCIETRCVEDEPHFLVTCPKYEDERKRLYDSIAYNPFDVSPVFTFTYIVNMNNFFIVARHINKCLQIRNST